MELIHIIICVAVGVVGIALGIVIGILGITLTRRANGTASHVELAGFPYHAIDTYLPKLVRAGERVALSVPVNEEGKIGVMFRNNIFQPRTRTFNFWQAIPAGVTLAVDTIADYWEQLKLIFQPKTKMYEELGGFIAIGNIFPSEWNWLQFWTMTAFLSIILAVMNILPIPGLDGGHALFTLWEIITGRKASDKFLEVMQYIGLAILFVLLVYANGNDIYRLFVN